MTRFYYYFAALAVAVPASAAPLTVRVGDTVAFRIDHGEPVRPHPIAATAKPGRGEVKVAVRKLFGTLMTITNNSAQGYTFKAELIGVDGSVAPARTCTLPPRNQPTLESWPGKATAVRIGRFVPASGGRC